MTEIGLLGAFAGGLLALVSPCSALLLPSFFAYAFTEWKTLSSRTGVFFVGLAGVLVPLGYGVGAVGSAITAYRTQTTLVAALVIVAFGVMMLLGKGFTCGTAQRAVVSVQIGGPLSVLALGALYGLAGFCSGPLLGAVLTVAVTRADPAYGAVLMGCYAAGMTVPLAVLAAMWDKLQVGSRTWLRGRPLRLGPLRTHSTSLISGLLFIGIGVLFLLTGGTANLGGLLSADTQVALQGWLAGITADARNNLVVALAATLVVIVVLSVRVLRRPVCPSQSRSNRRRPPDTDTRCTIRSGGRPPKESV